MTVAILITLLGSLPAPTAATAEQKAHWAAEFEQALREFDEGQQLPAEQADRARRLFRSAARRLGNIAASGVRNGYLEYNLGNCHLQSGDVGRAVLHYRRAQLLIPRDPLLADNLALARSRCLTQIPPARRDAVMRSLFFWHYRTSEAQRAVVGAGCYVLAFGFLSARSFVRRRWLTVLAAIAAAVSLAFAGSIVTGRWFERNEPAAVVTAMDVPVYKGPGPGYQKQFEQPLQPGVECVVKEQRDRWWRIELPDGNTGWVAAETIEQVSEPRTGATWSRLAA